ncbi:hypothetical protein AACH10_12960 [Ideonella sp. DXS22W]|uniref:DUF922 domain-containing protein n=1 Tax=Pseudaquabacterium inlustre TaxID=2984192 RepID=A0ABU9CKB1_9BURK
MKPALALLLTAIGLPTLAAGLPACVQPVRFTAAWLTDPQFDHSKSAAELDALAGAARGPGTQLGHVVVKTQLSVEPQTTCNGLTVRLDFVQPVLRIAREMPAGSCSHALVMAHEQTHVRIHQEIARQFRALTYPWPDRLGSDAVLKYARQQLTRLMDAQRQFDSPQEYARGRTACAGEIPRLITPAQAASRTP